MSVFSAATIYAGAQYPDAGQLPAQPGWPNPLATFEGTSVTSKKLWQNTRRRELKELFQHYMYGAMPPAPARMAATVEREDKTCFGGKATLKEVTIPLTTANGPRIHLLLVTPNQHRKAVPGFVGLNFCGNHALLADPKIALPSGWMPKSCAGCTNNQATDSGRGSQIEVWALEQSIDRGYAVATFYNGDVEPDHPDAPEGIRQFYSKTNPAYDWGTIAAWAWGLSRVVDYLITEKNIDSKRIAVVGHSRNGKAALLAAAFDERIALAIPLQAGCGGTAPSRGKIGESVKQINNSFPHWFNAEFKKFNEQPERLPFDQNCLVALMAPRPVLFSNATEDTWANPEGQFEMLKAAEPVYQLLKAGGLESQQMPETGKLSPGKLGYYIRPGKHSMTRDDWAVFLDYADRQLK
jgi:dienelactone hydrolase